ncbi:hypothetical protein BT93_K0574 [Corymbia citriodora subsp. variegata]|nr:hypothetical protein BT93_K0574 [Corymbia citriodora subsp. variegata]
MTHEPSLSLSLSLLCARVRFVNSTGDLICLAATIPTFGHIRSEVRKLSRGSNQRENRQSGTRSALSSLAVPERDKQRERWQHRMLQCVPVAGGRGRLVVLHNG